MKKFLQLAVVLMFLTSVFILSTAQIPNHRDKDRIQLLNDAVVAPDGLYVS